MEYDPSAINGIVGPQLVENSPVFSIEPLNLDYKAWQKLVTAKEHRFHKPAFFKTRREAAARSVLSAPGMCDPVNVSYNGEIYRYYGAADIHFPSVAWMTDGEFKYTRNAETCFSGLAVVRLEGQFFPKMFHLFHNTPEPVVKEMLGGEVVGGYFGSGSLWKTDNQTEIYLNLGLKPLIPAGGVAPKSVFHIMADLQGRQVCYSYSKSAN